VEGAETSGTRAAERRNALDSVTPGTVSLAPLSAGTGATEITAGWRRIRLLAFAAYFGVLAWIVITQGVPTARPTLAVIIVTGLALTSIGRTWRHTARVILDWLPFTAVLMIYDRTRGVADRLGISLHEKDIVRAEEWLFGGTEPTIWLQHHMYDPAHVYWYDALCTLVYTSHFLATPILAALLWLRDRALWLRYISRVVVLSFAGLITYCLFPEAPPWMAARDGLTEPVARLSARGWIWLHASNVNDALANAQNDGANPIAAMPSLHVAFAALVALMIATRIRSGWRYLLALYPAAMGFTLVYCGEHYVLDLVAGVAYAYAVHLALNQWERRRRRRRADSADRAERPESSGELDDREPLASV
jgi:membrane-associated phospholipid phosphatase